MKPQMIIITVLVAIVMAGAGFFGGVQYQKSQKSTLSGNINSLSQFRRNTQNNIRGQILSTDANTMTVKLADGSGKIVVLGVNTQIMQATTASRSALQAGTNVMVMGTTNPDGSVTAANIQINPNFGRPTGQ